MNQEQPCIFDHWNTVQQCLVFNGQMAVGTGKTQELPIAKPFRPCNIAFLDTMSHALMPSIITVARTSCHVGTVLQFAPPPPSAGTSCGPPTAHNVASRAVIRPKRMASRTDGTCALDNFSPALKNSEISKHVKKRSRWCLIKRTSNSDKNQLDNSL